MRLVWPPSSTPFLRQRYVNGPVPLAVVENTAPSPTHRLGFASAVAVVFELIVSVAQLVTVLHGPLTSTQYNPPCEGLTFDNTNWLFVSPGKTVSPLRHKNANGPVPLGTVLNAAVPPGQAAVFASGVVLVLVNTVTAREQVLCSGPSLTVTCNVNEPPCVPERTCTTGAILAPIIAAPDVFAVNVQANVAFVASLAPA